MAMKGLRAMMAVLVLMSVAFSLSVSPTSVVENMTVGGHKSVLFNITNDANETVSVTFSKTGDIASWISFSESTLTIANGSTAQLTIYINVPSDEDEGQHSATIFFNANNSDEANATVTVNVIKWLFQNEYWIKEGSTIEVEPFGVSFVLYDVGAEVNTSLGMMSPGDTKLLSNGNVKVELLDRYGDEAKFKIYTTDSSTSVNIEEPQTQSSEGESEENKKCGLEPVISLMAFKIQKDSSTTKYISFRNTCDETIDVNNIYFSGDIIDTPQGTKPLSFQAEVGPVDPGEEITIRIDVNSHDVDPGRYAATLYVIGYMGNERKEAKTDFILDVLSSVSPSQMELNPNVTYPKTVTVGDAFTITITNIPADANVVFLEPAHVVRINSGRVGNYYYWEGKIDQEGTYSIYVTISYMESAVPMVLTITAEKPVPKNIRLDVTPQVITPGSYITVNTYDQETNALIDADITVRVHDKKTGALLSQFTYQAPFIAECGKKYYIEATYEGYTPANKWVEVSNIPTSLDITPANPKINDTVTIKYISLQDSSPVPNAKIKVNGVEYTGSVVTVTADSETLDITASADCYDSQHKVINVELPLALVESHKGEKVGEEMWWYFNKPVEWSLLDESNNELASGTAQNVTLLFDQPGTYYLYVNGEEYETIEVKKGFTIPSVNPLIVVAVLAIAFLLFGRGSQSGGVTEGGEQLKIPKFRLGGKSPEEEFRPPASQEIMG